MTAVADLTYELLKRVYAEFGELREEMERAKAHLSSLERHHAAMSGDLAAIRSGLDDIRSDVSHIKRRLGG